MMDAETRACLEDHVEWLWQQVWAADRLMGSGPDRLSGAAYERRTEYLRLAAALERKLMGCDPWEVPCE